MIQLRRKLKQAEKQLRQLDAERQAVSSEVEKIMQRIRVATQKATANVRLGMTASEVTELIGSPRSYVCGSTNYNYGDVWVIFEDGLVGCIVKHKAFRSCEDCGLYDAKDKIR